MRFIYKVVGNFESKDFNKLLQKISTKFLFTYTDNVLFLALKDINVYDGSEELINKAFRPVRDFYIEEITEKNIMNLSPAIKDWCLTNLVRLDTEKYEKENQEKLKQVWLAMDRMEEELLLKKKGVT